MIALLIESIYFSKKERKKEKERVEEHEEGCNSHLTIIVNNFNIRNSYVAIKLKYRIRHRDSLYVTLKELFRSTISEYANYLQ